PAWLAGGVLLYQDGAGAVWTVNADGTDAFVFAEPEPGERLAAYVDRDGARVVLVRAARGVGEVQVLDALRRPVGGPYPVPVGADDAPPVVRLHPTDDRLLVAALDGDAEGLGVLDPARGAFFPVAPAPTSAALWAPDGEGVYALEPAEGRVRLVHRPLADPDRATELVRPSPYLAPDVLDWATPTTPVAPADRDRDGLHDRDDLCPDWRARGPLREPTRLGSATVNQYTDTQVAWHGHEWTAGWVQQETVRLRFVDARGVTSSTRVLADNIGQYRPRGPTLAWSGRRYMAAVGWYGSDRRGLSTWPILEGAIGNRRDGGITYNGANPWIRWNGDAFDVLAPRGSALDHMVYDDRINRTTLNQSITGAEDAETISVAPLADGWLVAFGNDRTGSWRSFVATLDRDFVVTNGPVQGPGWQAVTVVPSPEGAVMVGNGAGGVYSQRFNTNGVAVGGATKLSGGGYTRSILLPTGPAVLTSSGDEGRLQHLTADGQPRSRPIPIASGTSLRRFEAAAHGHTLVYMWTLRGDLEVWLGGGDEQCAE
ncbi:MAG: hypothetical protein KC583_24480, partial [Myxococcales bacterium]|nr:hypothetical protein [Myxococcales bacterium]